MDFKRQLYTILMFLLPLYIYSQNNIPVREFIADNYINNTDSLRNLYCAGKAFVREYELPAIIALSHYPELDSAIIDIKVRRLNKLGQARPKIDFLLRKPDKRHYLIVVNKKSKEVVGFDFNDIPFNAQIGFFGHELAHITDYNTKNNIKLMLFGLIYLLKKEKIEKYTDRLTIRHNLGWQLYDLNIFITNNPDTDKNYLRYKKNKYLNPHEILNEMQKFDNIQTDPLSFFNYY